jgi:PKD repeat protein
LKKKGLNSSIYSSTTEKKEIAKNAMKPIRFYIGARILIPMLCAIALFCGKQQPPTVLIITSAHGDILIIRPPQAFAPTIGTAIINNDTIRLGDGAGAEFSAGNSQRILCRGGSCLTVHSDPNMVSASKITILSGDALFLTASHGASALGLCAATPLVSVKPAVSAFAIVHYPTQNASIVKSLLGHITVTTSDSNQPITMQACSKVLLAQHSEPREQRVLTGRDIDALTDWIPQPLIDSLLAAGACGELLTFARSQPPIWLDTPAPLCRPGIMFIDTLRASAPMPRTIAFALVNEPHGMSIDNETGIIRYRPRLPATHEIIVKAIDETGLSTPLTWILTVTGTVNAVLLAPAMIRPGDTALLDASRSVNEQGTTAGLRYRCSGTGEQPWNEPFGNVFGPANRFRHTFGREGTYEITLDVRSASGATSRTKRQVIVNIPPRASAHVEPSAGTSGTLFHFSSQASSDSGTAPGRLLYRWDFDNDGKWEYPTDSGFSATQTITHQYNAPGEYAAVMQVRDPMGAIAAETLQVAVFAGVTLEKLHGPDSALIGQPVTFTCDAGEQHTPITDYAWDCDGDATFEQSGVAGSVQTRYAKAGTYTISCTATNAGGINGTISRTITIVNTATDVDAGGPYTTAVNDTLALIGSAHDTDNAIVAYLWDFNTDSKPDQQSDKSMAASHVFTHQGNYPIAFGVKTDDGVITWDTALVSVSNTPPRASAGEDQTSHVGRKVKLSGRGLDAENNIAAYSWDFDADGTYDWTSTSTGTVEHGFKEYSFAILRVIDGDSASATDTVKIVVCPRGMALIEEGKYCMDIYEWPNRKGGQPQRDVTFELADKQCRDAGKRLCSAEEWTKACRGVKEQYTYPYGRLFVETACNQLLGKRSPSGVAPAGEFSQCTSPFGVADMSGNVAEWTASTAESSAAAYGGSWQDNDLRTTCGAFAALDKGKKYPYVGFRCCK